MNFGGHWSVKGMVAFLFLAAAWSRPIAAAGTTPTSVDQAHRVIIFVWDGLRPDLVDSINTPNLARLRDAGVNFVDHHSTYPTITMINAASLATGAYPATH